MGLISLIITLAVCVIMTVFVIKKPVLNAGFLKFAKKPLKLESYYVIALIAPLALLAVGALSLSDIAEGITADGNMNPLKILLLFFSMCLISICLDKAGFFEYCAAKTLKSAAKGQKRLFRNYYFFIALLTVFTSNDIIILAFTPFICYYCKSAKISPLPYIAAQFAAANTFSLMLIIGNPTNIYIGASLGITFFQYIKYMALPALAAGCAAYAALRITFRKALNAPVITNDIETAKIKNKPAAAISLAALGLCILFMSASNFINIQMWIVSAVFAAMLCLSLIILKIAGGKKNLYCGVLMPAVKSLPFGIIPFLLSMFAAVLALNKHGVTAQIAALLPAQGNIYGQIFGYGFISAAACNMLNNIPMSVLFTSVINAAGGISAAAYATIIGSNIGAFLSPAGALAGIMLLNLIKDKDTGFTSAAFVKYLAPSAVISLAASLGALALCFAVIG